MIEDFPLKFNIKLIGPKNQVVVEAPADTCAHCSIIGSFFLEKLGYEKNKLKRIQLATITGNIAAYQCKVRVVAEGKEIDLDMIMIDDLYCRPTDSVILGIDFLKGVNFSPRRTKEWKGLFRSNTAKKRVVYSEPLIASGEKSEESILSKDLPDMQALCNRIKEYKRKSILVLGSYSKEREHILYAIQECLGKMGYKGILLKDYEDIEEQSNEQKMNLLASIAGFMICENTYPSGHIAELRICAENTFPTIILQEQWCKMGATGMQSSYPIDFNFVKRVFYDPKNLELAVKKAVKIGEALVVRRRRKLNKEYTYRKKD